MPSMTPPYSFAKGYKKLKKITYQINDKNGIHARPAGLIVQCAKRFVSDITLELNEKNANCKKLFSVMQLGAKFGNTVTIAAQGSDEEEAAQSLYNTMRDAGL